MNDLKKRNLWLVSATPNLDNFEEVRQIADYFDVNLGIKDYTQMEPDVLKKATSTMTSKLLKFTLYVNHTDFVFSVGEVLSFRLSQICGLV